ncbi:hypothetical protein POVWA1_062560 [Plasmodium ovale wallikeri]|uniref:Uncharacterized protein n=1 Tax=Plasmodium ovale wallikeri TaxID=864142 RepID=A0A1A9A4H7_PLAOA|nr:hypothetical protein POVWA1_062560 [Plasmodium ovale wallikeri]
MYVRIYTCTCALYSTETSTFCAHKKEDAYHIHKEGEELSWDECVRKQTPSHTFSRGKNFRGIMKNSTLQNLLILSFST